jgi:hypothetical protein
VLVHPYKEKTMIDGTYKVSIKVPFGRAKEGTIVLRTEGDVAYAQIDAPIVGKQQVQGHVEGDTFTAEGSGRIQLVGKVDYTLDGKVTGDDLHIDIHSNKGEFQLDGVRA